MLAAVKEIGELVIEKEGRQLLEVLVEDPNSSGNYKHIITINLEEKGGQFCFRGVEREEYDRTRVMKYLYRKGSGTGADYSPTAKVTDKPEGTFDRKIMGWFRVLEDKKVRISGEERAFLQGIRDELSRHSSAIKRAVVDLRDQTPKKENMVLTLKLLVGGSWKYVGEFEIFRRLLENLVLKKDYTIYASNRVCSICGDRRDTVLGAVSTYTFYTIDKRGFITGGFKEEDSWKNFPVCPTCKAALEEGKKYIEKNLSFKFYGLNYYLIPKSILGGRVVYDQVLDVLTDMKKLISLKQKVVDRITDDEEEILTVLADARDTVALNFLFLKKQQSAERILLLVEDVLPSRLRKIFAAKEAVDGIIGSNFTFRCIRNFLGKSDSNKRDYDLNAYFLDLTDRIFKGRPVDYHFLLQLIMKKVREEFVNDGYFFSTVRDGLVTLLFLEKLGLISWEEISVAESALESLFAKYGPPFQSPLKRGLFLLGSLTELLLRKQYSERESRPPFLKNLKGLKMNERDFKGLLPKVQNKLEEYDAFDKGKRLLAKEASAYLLMAGDNWKMSVDEMNFCFAAGMNLADEVAGIVYEKEEN